MLIASDAVSKGNVLDSVRRRPVGARPQRAIVLADEMTYVAAPSPSDLIASSSYPIPLTGSPRRSRSGAREEWRVRDSHAYRVATPFGPDGPRFEKAKPTVPSKPHQPGLQGSSKHLHLDDGTGAHIGDLSCVIAEFAENLVNVLT